MGVGDANADNESGEADSTAEEKVETPAEEKVSTFCLNVLFLG